MNLKILNFDPRIIQFCFLFSYSIIAVEYFNFERSHKIVLITFLSAILIEMLLSKYKYKKKNSWLPAGIITFSVCTLVYSPTIIFYIVTVTLAILSKSLFQNKGRHFFNPSNFGITITTLIFPNWIVGSVNTFSGVKAIGIYFFIAGFINAFYSKTLIPCLTFLVSTTLLFMIRGQYFDIYKTSFTFMYFVLSPVLLLYTFHMINDPASIPKTNKLRFFYAILLSVIYTVMSYFRITQAHFYALFLLTLFTPFIHEYEEKMLRNRNNI